MVMKDVHVDIYRLTPAYKKIYFLTNDVEDTNEERKEQRVLERVQSIVNFFETFIVEPSQYIIPFALLNQNNIVSLIDNHTIFGSSYYGKVWKSDKDLKNIFTSKTKYPYAIDCIAKSVLNEIEDAIARRTLLYKKKNVLPRTSKTISEYIQKNTLQHILREYVELEKSITTNQEDKYNLMKKKREIIVNLYEGFIKTITDNLFFTKDYFKLHYGYPAFDFTYPPCNKKIICFAEMLTSSTKTPFEKP